MARHLLPAHVLFTREWWSATWRRVAWTAIAATVAVLPGLTATREAMVAGALFVVLAAAGALVTAMVNLPEVSDGGSPLWQAILVRVARTAGQTLAAGGILTATTLADVAWSDVGQAVLVASVITALRTLATTLGPVDPLPEAMSR